MPFARPTLTQLRDQVQQDIAASPAGLTGFLRNAIVPILGWAQAGLAYLHYAYLDWIAKQAVPWSASDEWLFAWAALKGIYQKDATAASGSVTLTGTGSVPAGAQINRADGAQYTVTATTAVSGSTSVLVTAVAAGSAGNTDAGTIMALASPITGIASSGVSGVIVGGADQETQEAMRARMLAAYAAPPQGGDASDYVEWALAVPGVTRAWVTPNGAGAGTVVVYPMLDIAESGTGGFPVGTNGIAPGDPRDTAATGDQRTVATAIYLKQPVTALVYVTSPINTPINFSITGLGSNNTTAMQAAITAALVDMFLRLGNVGGTVDPSVMAAWPGIEPNAWYEALGAISGLTTFDVATPASAITPTAGELFTLGTVTFAS